jgi:hypothetical protein
VHGTAETPLLSSKSARYSFIDQNFNCLIIYHNSRSRGDVCFLRQGWILLEQNFRSVHRDSSLVEDPVLPDHEECVRAVMADSRPLGMATFGGNTMDMSHFGGTALTRSPGKIARAEHCRLCGHSVTTRGTLRLHLGEFRHCNIHKSTKYSGGTNMRETLGRFRYVAIIAS